VGRFAVWAPAAATVDVHVGGGGQRLTPTGRGWHEGADPRVGPGADYAFSLDGGPALPDPRSPRQARGVHGPSQLVDHAAFAWRDDGWRGRHLRDCVVYEMHCGTFSEAGTFDGAIEHIPDLVDLGVGAVEVMPVTTFPGSRGWGYDGVDLFAVHEALGGPDALKRFVDACHAAGIAVVIDVVYNHLGPDGNVLGSYGPYFTATHRTPWGDAVNYDAAGSDEVRRFVVDNALMWVQDYHCDGLRLDAIHAIVDTSAVHIVEEIARSVHSLSAELGRELWVIAESDLNDPRVVCDPGHGGYGCDAQWSDDFHHALHSSLTGERDGYYADFGRASDVAAALRHVFVNPGGYSPFRDRTHGRPVGTVSADHFLGYLQNHDQVGNRARGDRSAALMSVGRLRIGAALVLLGPFVPMLFAGEEWAASTPFQYFTDHQDADLGHAVSEGRRREFAAFGWDPVGVPDPQDAATFARSRLQWDERRTEPHRSVLDWHRRLIGLRRGTLAARGGDLSTVSVEADDDARTLVMSYAGLTVACNWGDHAADLTVSSGAMVEMAEGASLDGDRLRLQADSVAVLRAPN
jgi:maltooligosyltrehalose trehalohydrolase